MAPAAFVPVKAGAVVFFGAMLACTWATVLLVIRPWTTGRMIAGALLGAVVLYSLPSEDGLSIGQPTALLALGVALAIRAIIRSETGWIAVIGVTITLLKLQTTSGRGDPSGNWDLQGRNPRDCADTITEPPWPDRRSEAAHGVLPLIRSWRTNLHYFNTLNSTLTLRIRVDLAGTAHRLTHYDITILEFVFAAAFGIAAVLLIRRVGPGLWMWPFISSFLTIAIYHQQYDVLVPLLCFIPIILEQDYRFEVRLICIAMLLVDLACRPNFLPHWQELFRVSNASAIGGISTLTTFILLAIVILVSGRVLAKWRSGQPKKAAKDCAQDGAAPGTSIASGYVA